MNDAKRREKAGTERVGKPIAMVVQTARRKASTEAWSGKISTDRLLHYCEGFLFSVFPELVDRSTRHVEMLEAIDPTAVMEVVVILLRDSLLQEFAGLPRAYGPIDSFIGDLASELGLGLDRVFPSGGPFNIDSMSNMRWAQDLMIRLGLAPGAGMLLFVPHASFVKEQMV